MYLSDDADMTIVFNAITKENMLSDKAWELVIDRHYEKFRYFYKLLKATKKLKTITKLSVRNDEDTLDVVIEFKSVKSTLSFIDKFNECIGTTDFKYSFDVERCLDGRILNIKIMNCNILEEGDLYESIFDTDR